MLASSTTLKAQEVSILIMPGWNWISIPGMDTLDFATALGSFTPENGDVIRSYWGNVRYLNGQWRGNISQFYPGHGYHYKSSRTMPVMLTLGKPLPQVLVTTSEATGITTVSAEVGGTVTVGDGIHIFARGVCWGTESVPTIDGNHLSGEAIGGNQNYALEGLTPSSIYYVRAYMVTDYGLAYGEEMSFTTLSGIPVVTTLMVTDITANDAVCGGTLTSDGGLNIIARGVCWSTDSNPTVTDAHTTDGTGTGSFVSALTGLASNTTYYVRAYATNSHTTAYGEEMSFATLTIPNYTVMVSVNPAESGTVEGSGTYEQGQTCTLTATADEGYAFTYWTENDEAVSSDATYTFTVTADRTFVANFTQAHTGVIKSLFSVSADQQVFFSQGNLQYQASTNTWKFADNQWDYVGTQNPASGNSGGTVAGSDNQNISSSYSGWIDLFGWGTSGYHDANDPYNVNYQPWSTSTSQVNSSYNCYGYGPSTNMTAPNLTGTSANYDWGVNNPISNGGNQTNQWRILTKEEWDYVFNTRTTTSGIRYAKAKVNNVNGVILLPDDWNSSTYSLSYTNNSSGASFSSNTMTASQWSILEQAGAVFLPAVGGRSGISVSEIGSCGLYWSASYSDRYNAYCVYFRDSYLFTNSDFNRYYGHSVRLVAPSENYSFVIYAVVSLEEGGSIEGSGTYVPGQTCTLTATANEGYTFVNWTESGTVVSTDATYAFTVKSDRTFVANFIYNGTGTLNGLFSVSADQQVYFSQGNLQYRASTNTWKFANNQYDYVGSSNSNISLSYNGWIDLFGWGTSGYHDANDPYNVNYQPWSTSVFQVNSSYNYYGYGPSTNMTAPNLTGTSANYDWGVNNPISNGGNTSNQWRTLTKEEWQYVFNTRTTASGIRYAKAKVNNICGVILLPDDWSSSTFSLSNANTYNASFSSNTLTASQWSTLEQAGAVFLPAAGNRPGTSVNDVGSDGSYWSASYSNSFNAYSVNFNDSDLSTGYYYVRFYGRSVRLVCPAQNYSSYVITAVASPAEGGEVSGGGTYEQGTECTLTATANEGYPFTYWTENGEVVSTDATYTFTVTGDRTLVANFTQNGGNAPTGAIDGLFSVSEGQQVYFSQGNLQYQASTDTWKFAENQYDYIGSTNSNISSSYSGLIDLFGWGTSGWNSGNTYYHPWDSDNSSGSTYGPPGQYDLTGSYANADWGVNNPISNGGNTANQWRTLTQFEWDYVFNTRTTTSGIRYAKANVNNVNGIILLPDDWSSGTYSLSNTNRSGASFSSNTLTASQWSTLEQAGAVFLPAVGYRDGASVSSVGSSGCYWSASYYDSNGAIPVSFGDSYLITNANVCSYRYYGRSVRLVRVAEN